MDGITFPRAHSDITVHLTNQGLWSVLREVQPTLIGYDFFGAPQYTAGGLVDTVVDQRQLMSLLTPDEVDLLLGYCAHVCEHGRMAITDTITALIHANTRKDWEQVTYLCEQIHAATEQLHTADETGRLILGSVHDDVTA